MVQSFSPYLLRRAQLRRNAEYNVLSAVTHPLNNGRAERRLIGVCFKYGVFVREPNGALIELTPKFISALLSKRMPYKTLGFLDRAARCGARNKRVVLSRALISLLQGLPNTPYRKDQGL